MIYLLDVAETRAPRGWFAYDEEDLACKLAAELGQSRQALHDSFSPRGLLALEEPVPEAELANHYPGLCALADAYGWDQTLYRADGLLGNAVLSTEPVSLRAALEAALAGRAVPSLVYWNDRDALAAFEGGDPRIAGPSHWSLRRQLHEQLVALELLADDT